MEETGDLIGNNISDKITKASTVSLQHNLETVTNAHDKEIPEEKSISPKERQKIIDLRLM